MLVELVEVGAADDRPEGRGGEAVDDGTDEGDPEQIGDAVALAGVSRYPARVKCALLPWMAFTDALARAGATLPAPNPPTEPTP